MAFVIDLTFGPGKLMCVEGVTTTSEAVVKKTKVGMYTEGNTAPY